MRPLARCSVRWLRRRRRGGCCTGSMPSTCQRCVRRGPAGRVRSWARSCGSTVGWPHPLSYERRAGGPEPCLDPFRAPRDPAGPHPARPPPVGGACTTYVGAFRRRCSSGSSGRWSWSRARSANAAHTGSRGGWPACSSRTTTLWSTPDTAASSYRWATGTRSSCSTRRTTTNPSSSRTSPRPCGPAARSSTAARTSATGASSPATSATSPGAWSPSSPCRPSSTGCGRTPGSTPTASCASRRRCGPSPTWTSPWPATRSGTPARACCTAHGPRPRGSTRPASPPRRSTAWCVATGRTSGRC